MYDVRNILFERIQLRTCHPRKYLSEFIHRVVREFNKASESFVMTIPHPHKDVLVRQIGLVRLRNSVIPVPRFKLGDDFGDILIRELPLARPCLLSKTAQRPLPVPPESNRQQEALPQLIICYR